MTEVNTAGFFSFRREFDKTHYPLLGDDDDQKSYRSSHGCHHSTTVPAMVELLKNVKGKWRYPVNGADMVFPGIYLGDETTALCTRWVFIIAIMGGLGDPLIKKRIN